MQLEPSNNSNEEVFSQTLKLEKDNLICKDGFCSLPNKNQKPNAGKPDINLFDPI